MNKENFKGFFTRFSKKTFSVTDELYFYNSQFVMDFLIHAKSFFQSGVKFKSIFHFSYVLFSYVLATILVFSGMTKLVDASSLLATLQQLSFLNSESIVLVATLLPVLEIGLAAALFLGWSGDCGCFGGAVQSTFGWEMLIRNFVLFCVAGGLWVRKSHL